jgi:Gpi18-like mannosyltransferase
MLYKQIKYGSRKLIASGYIVFGMVISLTSANADRFLYSLACSFPLIHFFIRISLKYPLPLCHLLLLVYTTQP